METNHEIIKQIQVTRCQMGDDEAFAELINQYQRPLRYFIENMIHDSMLAEDIFQETWLTVFRKIRTLKEPLAFASWLYNIARNHCYMKMRKEQRVMPLLEVANLPDNSINIEIFYEDVTKLHMCLAKLKPVFREVLMLRFLENMTYQEIAETTDSNEGTVKSRIYYAKIALREEMER